MPIAALSALFIVAVPAGVLMLVWTVVTMARILWPEPEPLPIDVLLTRHERAWQEGAQVPVCARDIVDDLRRRAHPVSTQSPVPADARGLDAPDPRARLAADLWVRRN